MEKILEIFRRNYPALIVGLCVYGMYVYYTYSGSRICDCETTENYRPSRGSHAGVSRFYHK